MMTDADEQQSNRTCARGHERPAAPHPGRRHHVAAHFSRVASSQLSAVLLGPTRVAHRHVDAADCDELVRLRNYEFEIFARGRLCGRIRADDAFVSLGWNAR